MANKRKNINMQMELKFPYLEEESNIFGKIRRPRIKIKILSETSGDWEVLDEVLADTGADLTILPRFMGRLLVDDITAGKYFEVKGVVPGAMLIIYVHELKIKLGDKKFVAPVGIADSDNVPAILGRAYALDLFDANFIMGEKLKLCRGD